MIVSELISKIEHKAPLRLQESYDNSGLQIGDVSQSVQGVLLCIDITEEVVDEAIEQGFNVIISHHPLLFRGLKSIAGNNYIERCVIKAIMHHIVLYSAHTNLDNALEGVNHYIAQRIGLIETSFLLPQNTEGITSGSGIIGMLPHPTDAKEFLQKIKTIFNVGCIKHSPLLNHPIQKVAACGGSGAFLIKEAKRQKADLFITADLKYHDFFESENLIILADIGHYESEQFTKELISDIIRKKSCNFAVRYTNIKTNPINYL